jgi:hypothetical protein
MEEVARMIAEEAGKRYQAYNRLVDGWVFVGILRLRRLWPS